MRCEKCDASLVPPFGPEKADIFLAGEFPGWKEIREGVPFIGDTGDILRKEISIENSFNFLDCRTGNVWLHSPSKACDMSIHVEAFLKELKNHKYVLLMGSEFGDVLYPGGVMENNGRVIRIGKTMGIITVNPALLPKGSVGEFRYALGRFGRLIGGENVGRPYTFKSVGTGAKARRSKSGARVKPRRRLG